MKYLFSLFCITALLLTSCTSNETEAPSNEQNEAQDMTGNERPFNSTRDSLSALIAKTGGTAELYARRALAEMDQQLMKAAFNDINQALLLDTNLAVVHQAKGQYHYMLDQLPRARDEWEKCLQDDPQNADCLMRLARLMIAMNKFDRALELVNRQLENDENDPQAYFFKGMIARDRNHDTTLALQYFQHAIDLDQDYFDAIDMMAVTLTHQKDTLARFYYDRMIELEPKRADTYYKLGVFYMNNDQPNRALEAYTRAIQLNPRDANSYYNLGYMHMGFNQYEKARGYFTNAIKYGDRDYQAYFGRGYSFEAVGDILNAKKDYEAALEDLPMYKPAQRALARVNAMLNEDSRAGGAQ